MALQKQTINKGTHTLVTFTVEQHEAHNSSQVLLLGDFNNWHGNDSASEMAKEGDAFVKQLKLENGKRYEFRYLSEGQGWFNDSSADDYVASPYAGIDNSVVDLSAIVLEETPAKKPVAKKTKAKKAAPQKATKKKDPAKKAATKKAKKDDLKKIEGIGPKIASIFAEKGIDTFKKLSEAAVENLEQILKEAGPRYSMHKPGTWPKQAKLAHEGKWEELKTLQDQLKGGR